MKQNHIYNSEEKLKWFGTGEWVEEPDMIEFEHKGFKCSIVRVCVQDGPIHVFGGHLCGYVNIPKDHPWIGKAFDIDADIHGGITFGEYDNEKQYWIGFDCGHLGDIVPSMELMRKEYKIAMPPYLEKFKNSPIFNSTYRNLNYVIEECKNLADQVIENDNRSD